MFLEPWLSYPVQIVWGAFFDPKKICSIVVDLDRRIAWKFLGVFGSVVLLNCDFHWLAFFLDAAGNVFRYWLYMMNCGFLLLPCGH